MSDSGILKIFCCVSLALATILAVASPTLAFENTEIIQLYDQYNTQLKQLNLSEPMSPVGEGKAEEKKFSKKTDAINTNSLNKYYSKAMQMTRDECYRNSNCRLSDLMFLNIATMSKYDVIAVEKTNDGSVKVVVVGINASGAKIKLILYWLFEDGEWKIDSVTKRPPN